jgi:NAD(P)H-dependent FMN reductase
VSKPILQIIIASTRPGRVGLPVAQWFAEFAGRQGAFDVELVDLADVALPLFDEPNHPLARQYLHPHTIAWSETVSRADAFVFVMPEYNHSFNAALKNALDYLHAEWNYKPVGFVSYGGVAAGTRAMTALKPVVAALRMTPVVEAVNIPFVAQFVNDEGRFVPNEQLELGAAGMLAELAKLDGVLRPLRTPSTD